jgi:hypothetical protein
MKHAVLVLFLTIVSQLPSMAEDTRSAVPAKGYLAPTLRLEPLKATSEEFADMFARQICTRKAGVGQLNGSIFILLARTEKNEIITPKRDKWVGLNRDQNEAVFVFNDTIFHGNALPKDFELTKSILISFEGDIVRFFNFQSFAGGLFFRD